MSVTLQEIQVAFEDAEAEVKRRSLNGVMRRKLTMEKIEALFAGAEPEGEGPEPDPDTDKRYVSCAAVLRAYLKQPSTAGPRIQRVFSRSPQLPAFYGTAEAAESLDLPKSHMYRLRDNGRLPEPVAELANGPVFIAHEIDALAVELRAERDARAERREAKRLASLG